MYKTQIPKARQDGLVVQKMPEELLVYDTEANRAHCLNETVAAVWSACDGKNSVSTIAKSFEGVVDEGTSEDLVLLAIGQLQKHDLLEDEFDMSMSGQTRRELIKKVGFASVIALPVIASLAAPKNVMAAASCACVTNGDCAAQVGCPSLTNCNGSGVCAP
jgi:hypothetical protein